MSINANDYHLHLFTTGNTALPRRLTCVDVPLVNAGEEKKWQ